MFCFSQSVLRCILIVLCLLSVVFADSSPEEREFNQNYEFYDEIEVCASRECRATAARWREAMDLTVDPCEDFFQYACGGFIAKNPVNNANSINSREQITNVQSSLKFMNSKLIKMLLGESYQEELRKAREFFADCTSKNNLPNTATLSTFEDRLQNCTFLTIHNFRWPVGSSFIKQNPHEETVGAVRIMMDAIKSEFWKIVNDSEWMDESSLHETAMKILNLTEVIGYHPSYLTESEEQRGDHNIRLRSPFAEEATYYKFTNILFVPLWTMSQPYFNLGLDVLNYGAIGATIGHEFGHLFASYTVSTTGRSNFIWPVEVREIFYKKEDCIAAQYAEEFKTFMSFWKNKNYAIDGIDTLDENLADYVGLKAAFYAYKRLNRSKRKLVDFENYSTEQLFFLSNANLMCASETKEYIKFAIIYEKHSPSRYRVNLPMANFDEFAKAWKCPLGSKMNPPDNERCVVW